MFQRQFLRSALAALLGMTISASAEAQLFRAYLASDGLDTNACTLPSPCRLLPRALTAVANNGEIWMLDSANYNAGPVDVNKTVTILAIPGALGSVVATGGNALNIMPGARVGLRNLVIVPLPGAGGIHGVNVGSGAGLTVENCLIANLPGDGIFANAASFVRVADTTIRNNSGSGLEVQNNVRATVTRSTISGNTFFGVLANGTVAGTTTTADITDSTMDGNNSKGVFANSTDATAVVKVSVRNSQIVRNTFGAEADSDVGGGPVTLSVSASIVSNNNIGIRAFGPGAKVVASGNTVTDNLLTGLHNENGALFESAGDNTVRNNPTGNTSGTITSVGTL